VSRLCWRHHWGDRGVCEGPPHLCKVSTKSVQKLRCRCVQNRPTDSKLTVPQLPWGDTKAKEFIFLLRVITAMLTHDIPYSICPSVCPSVRHVPVLYLNGLIYLTISSPHGNPSILVLSIINIFAKF